MQRVTVIEGIHCDFLRGGTVTFARGPAQLRAAHAAASTFDQACARLHPPQLVRGLVRVVERLGVTIYEGTEVSAWLPHSVTTRSGEVTFDTVVIAVEG